MLRLTPKWNLITHLNPKSPISESYRTLRTNIDHSTINQKLQIIMVTSSKPGEGKSTTCANMAVAFAQANKRVLLIDADLRKPTQHYLFGTSNRNGLTTALFNQKPLKDIVQHTAVDNLFIVHAGPTPPNPSELLSSPQMAELLDEARKSYDVIVLDTPPIVTVTDAQVVAVMSDGVVLIVQSGQVSKEHVLKAKSLLDHVKAKLLGVVLNNVNSSHADSYSYYYGDSEG
ncbi:capsular biosynthesis protein [Paenibacillus sp. MY03]|jgi:capsular exopolysaccharide synthesis family protein|uniref:non-specific protein-tyrosine kinase n=1 Tax=Paenibacillus agaridevorans TaxID=171404 RepID=A0A2R5F0Q7_9BACL|nr:MULTISPECIES: CpsD/CapB family tyrosine-protein kinase [Paenibacillus]OUS75402.1 capsular biosynthesis protein [Paenibacillus sp. MY03]GBG11945.1 capsular biosynthesis protein [Paenibacillus agaridevorans]